MQITRQHRKQDREQQKMSSERVPRKSSRRVLGIANFQCWLHTHPPRHSSHAFALSLLRVHVCSAVGSWRRYRERDLQCIFGYARSCAATNPVSAMHEPIEVETYQDLHVYFKLIPISVYHVFLFNQRYDLVIRTSNLYLANNQQ